MTEDQLRGLIKGCLKGSRKAQEGIYKLLYGKMLTVCMRYTRNVDEAQDILQEGLLKMFSNLAKYNFEGSFEGWVRRIVVNTAIDSIRKKKNDFILLGEHQSVEEFSEIADEEEEEAEFDFKPSDILAAMQKLTPAYQMIFNLYVFENMTHAEIAEKTGISVGTSKSNLAKAKRNLKKILINDFRDHNG